MSNNIEQVLKSNYQARRAGERVEFFHKHKYFCKGGMLPFMSKEDADKVCRLLQKINHKYNSNPDCNETFFIFHQDITEHFQNWGQYIPNKIINALDAFNRRHLLPKHRFLLQNGINLNKNFRSIIRNIWKYMPAEKFRDNKDWQAIISIEAITSHTYMESNHYWDRNNYSFFCGRSNIEKDENIWDTIKRETREEGKIVFSQEIFNMNYQKKMRSKYNLKLPMGIDWLFNPQLRRYCKTMLLFMEDIDMKIKTDENGDYLYIFLKK